MTTVKPTKLASRIYKRKRKKVEVIFYAPYPHNSEWICEYTVIGIPGLATERAPGVDAVAALQLALERSRIVLVPYAEELSWKFGAEPGDIGFDRKYPQFPWPGAVSQTKSFD